VRLVRAGPLRRRITYFFYYSTHANSLKVLHFGAKQETCDCLFFNVLFDGRPALTAYPFLAVFSQLVRLLLIIVLIGHYLACAFYAVAAPEVWFRIEECPGSKSCYKAPALERFVLGFVFSFGCNAIVTFFPDAPSPEPLPLNSRSYVTAYYTTFLLINGEETQPLTDVERSFAVLAILVG